MKSLRLLSPRHFTCVDARLGTWMCAASPTTSSFSVRRPTGCSSVLQPLAFMQLSKFSLNDHNFL